MKKNIVVTIARQYGSGGRTVGKMLAKELGINYYNKELLRLASEESGINEDLFLDADERCRTIGFLGLTAKILLRLIISLIFRQLLSRRLLKLQAVS